MSTEANEAIMVDPVVNDPIEFHSRDRKTDRHKSPTTSVTRGHDGFIYG